MVIGMKMFGELQFGILVFEVRIPILIRNESKEQCVC